jgi:hypothetical protein
VDKDADHTHRIGEMHRRIGRNLLRFQQIEHDLKFLMPYIHPRAHADGLEGFTKLKGEITNKTLGDLIARFIESCKLDPPELFDAELQKLLQSRNDLVHHFMRLPEFDWMSPGAVNVAIEYLDKQFESTSFVYDVVHGNAAAALCQVIAQPAYDDTDLAQYRQAIEASLPADFEVINLTDPERTAWGRTRIVRLLKQAEAETKSMDGMTFLSSAGAYIRRNAVDLGPKEYGLARLVDVLVVSKLFDVEFKPSSNEGAYIVKYRSCGSQGSPDNETV